MKITYKLLAGLLTFLVLQTNIAFSQDSKEEAQQPPVVVVTKVHQNYDYTEGTMKDWFALEKEYFDKVTSKNEYIIWSNVLLHMFTDDASEVLFVRASKDWCDIEKASERDNELSKEAWPDQEQRSEFFSKQPSITLLSIQMKSTRRLREVSLWMTPKYQMSRLYIMCR